MSTIDAPGNESYSDIVHLSKNIIGNMIIVIPNDVNILKKLNKIESQYSEQIVSKNQHFSSNVIAYFIVFEGRIQDFQRIVVEINGIKEIKNFRYLIIN
ncbi:MAG: hypothetical protein ACTSRI_05670 [Promethearchaeota archaeon]